tara:strand:- start:136 stop:1104 length:969 start_codon:yes stop_codon:yes gene_type:complete
MESTKACSCKPLIRSDENSTQPANEEKRKVQALHEPQYGKMVYLPGGTFKMGADGEEVRPSDGEGPIREVTLDPFYIDTTTVTNDQFSQFIQETGYVTEAERFGWSFVFVALLAKSKVRKLKAQTVKGLDWWFAIDGASWKKPTGSGSNIKKIMDHPVVQVSWNDAQSYCKWSGKRLPFEAEWEYASRGGRESEIFPWGNELVPSGKHCMNVWQGKFPLQNTKADGYLATAPAKHYKPNGFGLYNTTGNVWEWCQDFWSAMPHSYGANNPTGPIHGDQRVCRGGSFLCHQSYCNRYRCSARTSNTPDSASSNFGFRTVASAH